MGMGDIRHPAAHDLSVQIFALQPHLHIKLEVVLLSIRADRIVDLKLLIVLIHLELAASTSLSLSRSGEFCAFVLSNLAIGERRQGRYDEYCNRYDQSHQQVPPVGLSERFVLTTRFSRRVRHLRGRRTYNSNAGGQQTFRKSRQLAARCNTELVVGTKRILQGILI